MPTLSTEPEFAVSLRLDPGAPRTARHQVRLLASLSPDLRDAVVLLTSEIVTRAVEDAPEAALTNAELRGWVTPDLVRVELRGPSELARVVPGLPPWHFDVMLLDSIADRWSLDAAGEGACFWFEIDRV